MPIRIDSTTPPAVPLEGSSGNKPLGRSGQQNALNFVFQLSADSELCSLESHWIFMTRCVCAHLTLQNVGLDGIRRADEN
jgi:hypothetical protein